MPAKNSRKIYIQNQIYHVYNRGVDGKTIFPHHQNYLIFLRLLKFYLSDPEKLKTIMPTASFQNNLFQKIFLLSYCLMPNHFHLLVKQSAKDGMTKLLHRLSVTYSSYFNKKYHRQGTLFQGVYKAVSLDTPLQILHTSRYIHLNPIITKIDDDYKIIPGKKIPQAINYPYSSFKTIITDEKPDWLAKDLLLSNIKKSPVYAGLSYLQFLKKSAPLSPIPTIK